MPESITVIQRINNIKVIKITYTSCKAILS
jgi:hypothetical protein